MTPWFVYALGFVAQLLFSSRQVLQWLLSEKHKRILTPVLFWEISLFASFLLFVYGYLRDDLAIMFGQVITYYIYIRNMQLQKAWRKMHKLLQLFILVFPLVVIIYGFHNNTKDADALLNNENIPGALLLLGLFSQLIFTLRFVYQWIYSEKVKHSVLPMGFWVISFAGSLLIIVYAILRKDPVLFAGHFTGALIYSRSIIIKKNEIVAT